MKKKSKEKNLGHAAHSRPAAQNGLKGNIERPLKIVFMGAGSKFCSTILRDILCIDGDQGGEFALVDIDKSRLDRMARLVRKITRTMGKDKRWKVTASTGRKQALRGAHYVINSIEVSGTACVRFDNDIPAKYGIDQCIGDTIGPGGLFKGLRTIPVFLDILQDVEQLCPEAIVLNYTNPMSMLCLASFRTVPDVQLVGLCHSVQGTSDLLARRAGVALEEMKWECAGINHLAWFTKLEHEGRDLYPKLMKLARNDFAGKSPNPDGPGDLVRKDMMLHFGAFITESSGHLSEYLPYYRKREALLEEYARPRYDGESSFYANNWPTWRDDADKSRDKLIAGKEPIDKTRSWEYGSWIIEAREKDRPLRIHGNVYNNAGDGRGSLITNLASDACVEVACMVDQNGINPTRYGALPPQMAALCQSNLSMFDLAAQAAIEKSKELAIYAAMLDPLSAAVCSPAEIKKMTLEMFRAEKDFLPGFR